MARLAFLMELLPGNEAIYKQKHDEIWPELVETLRQYGVRNYSIFRHELTLYAYLECDDADRLAKQRDNPVVQRWWRMMEPYMVYNPDHTPRTTGLDEVFHMD
jgi:L-rhamnose mutarotase